MAAYLVRRLLQSIGVIFGVSIAVFLVSRLSGDPAKLLLSMYATPEDIEAFRRIMGLEDPLIVQYWRFLSNALRGDFGNSYMHHLPSTYLILSHLPATIELALASMAIAVAVGMPVGIVSAIKKNTIVEQGCMLLALLGQSTPVFWLGIMLILFFAVRMNWLPAGGSDTWRHLVLPAITLGSYSTASVARLTRTSVAEVLRQDYVRTAYSKGLRQRSVLTRHVLKNALTPIVTVIGLQFGTLLGGAVVTETIFAWPGVGRLAVDAVYTRDYPLIQATVFVVAVGFVVINTLLDILYHYLDPRIRL
jgi:ABC-type dipeptide/oligopeptide/nickel transport system permease component